MEEKYMVNDVLQTTKANLKEYENIILETENMELRQTLQNIRNIEESFQYELFKLAAAKGYYNSAEEADIKQIKKMRNELI